MRSSIDSLRNRTEPLQKRKLEPPGCQLEKPPTKPIGKVPFLTAAPVASKPGRRVPMLMRCPVFRSVARVPEAQLGVGPRRPSLAEEDRIGRPIGDVVITDAAIEEQHALIIGVDRRLDIMVTTRIGHRCATGCGRTEERRDRRGLGSQVAGRVDALPKVEPAIDVLLLEERQDLDGPAEVVTARHVLDRARCH